MCSVREHLKQGKVEEQHMWMRENKTNTSTTLKLTDEEKFTKYMPRDEMRTEETCKQYS